MLAIFTSLTKMSAFVIAISPLSLTRLLANNVTVTSGVLFCSLSVMAKPSAGMSARHSLIANLMTASFWNIVEVFWVSDFSRMVMTVTFESQRLSNIASIFQDLENFKPKVLLGLDLIIEFTFSSKS